MKAVRDGRGTSQPRRRHLDRLSWSVEAVAWLSGVVLLVAGGGRYVEGLAGSRQAIRQFTELRAAGPQPADTADTDLTLWSPERVAAWRTVLRVPTPLPLAVLRVPRVRLEVPVFDGTDEATLNRGAGHIEHTAVPGAPGNAGIAAHRDGFFRSLKDVRPGDAIELDTRAGTVSYFVERMWIVDPDDISVLAPTPDHALTLVTCYPFYFVGPAPQRFIVRAVRQDDD